MVDGENNNTDEKKNESFTLCDISVELLCYGNPLKKFLSFNGMSYLLHDIVFKHFDNYIFMLFCICK